MIVNLKGMELMEVKHYGYIVTHHYDNDHDKPN